MKPKEALDLFAAQGTVCTALAFKIRIGWIGLFFTKGDTEHSVTWHHYLDQGCVPVETRRFWGSGNGCLPLNGRSALCLMEPGRGQPLASMSFLSLCTFPSWVWGRQSRLQLVGWEWEVASYFGKMQREMAGQERWVVSPCRSHLSSQRWPEAHWPAA